MINDFYPHLVPDGTVPQGQNMGSKLIIN